MGYCYYCGAQTEGKEHVPAKTILNYPGNINAITVPSCKLHNQAKSALDELIALILIKPTLHGHTLFGKNPKKTEEENKDRIERLKNIYIKNLYNNGKFTFINGNVQVTDQSLLDEILEYFGMMSAGIYYSATNNRVTCKYKNVYGLFSHIKNHQGEVIEPNDDTLINNLIKKCNMTHSVVKNNKLEYHIHEFINEFYFDTPQQPSPNRILVKVGDILIITILHESIYVVNIFSSDKTNDFITSLHV